MSRVVSPPPTCSEPELAERQRADTALRESEERFAGAFEHAPIGVALVSPEGRWLKVNRALCDLVGYSEAELLTLTFQDITHSDDLQQDLEHVRRLIAGEIRTYQMEKRYVHALGHIVSVLLSVSLVRDQQGRPSYFIAQIQDFTERKRTEEALKESQSRYRSLFENMWEGYAYCRILLEEGRPRDFIYLEVNSAFETLTGLKNVVGKRVSEVIPGIQTANQDLFELYGRVASTGKPERCEIYLEPLQMWLSIAVYSPVSQHFIAVFDNITERKQTDLEIRFNEQRFRSLVEAITAFVWDTPPSGEFERPQPRWTAFTGQSFDQLRGWGWLNAVHPDDRAETARAWSAAVASQSIYETEHRLQARDTSYRNMLVRAVPILADNGTIRQWIGVHSDITERKQTENALRESDEKFHQLADHITDAFWIRSPDMRELHYVSPAFERIWGRPLATLYHNPDLWVEFTVPEDRARAKAAFAPLMADAPSVDVEYRITRPDGEIRWIRVRGFQVRNSARKLIRLTGIVTDITDKKTLELQILRAQRMESIGTLAGGMAHDLNNVLAPIMLSLEMLRDLARTEEDHSLLATLESSALRGAQLVKQVLSFARGVEGQRITVNPLHIMHDLRKVMRDTFPKSIEVNYVPAPGLWTVTGDPTQMHQVLLNLCVNARDAMPGGGRIAVSMENMVLNESNAATNPDLQPGAYVMIKVEDTGAGIPPEIMDRIFEPFFTTKPLGEGTGLGLSTTLAIVKSHGGTIHFHSTMGQGTIFTVYLPAKSSETAADTLPVVTTRLPRGHGELILVVDDEEAIRKIARRTLERFGYRVMLATNGAEAVTLYQLHCSEIAVVLTDMAMPVMDGATTITALKALNPAAKIIASSGFSATSSTEAVMAEIQHFVSKPYTTEALLTTIHGVLQA